MTRTLLQVVYADHIILDITIGEIIMAASLALVILGGLIKFSAKIQKLEVEIENGLQGRMDRLEAKLDMVLTWDGVNRRGIDE